MVLAATLHASSTALPATEESSFTIEKKASPGINQLSDGDGGRILRRVEQYATNEKGVEEERIYTKMRLLFNQAMHAAKVKSNGKDAGYLAALLARLRKEGK
ncbi:hypothetical protein F441_02226 [Phytophthora nicotianae CJ01A1]|uniref:RxLR effector protein n=4 Tax=Phytophthora nicotianae TaxID=4792 RepID=V9FWA5_PHYNI|nr:hypothetical protein F443_02251 [Phytophthora nicotianae P1569]ETK94859.1 hypothetical protein L915_02160 [Phytophthora nicotianae]ETP24844.1 hypothetical protein F441_02226 [Phytophthora nicotianae CJ01A1]ETP52837.1 hypothetical protein F442_02209 [Phytophthora nicotianae P10297]ETL48252.1 hypothetical protein L916_02123 [Phytophthora nicotianae]